MDIRTVQYREDHAKDVFAQYSSGKNHIEKYFAPSVPPGTEILSNGAGFNHDLNTKASVPGTDFLSLANSMLGKINSRKLGALPGSAGDNSGTCSPRDAKPGSVLTGQSVPILRLRKKWKIFSNCSQRTSRKCHFLVLQETPKDPFRQKTSLLKENTTNQL